MLSKYSVKDVYMFRIASGEDLISGINKVIYGENIKAGIINIIGALSAFRIGYYDQAQKKYLGMEGTGDFEILSCIGNVSTKEGVPFPHLHVSLADKDGRAFGGHLLDGCRVFVAEVSIISLEGPALGRYMDEQTGLALWPIHVNF